MGFWYEPIVAPPKDWRLWSELIRRFVQHLVARYGIDEVAQWYFEVWNEPNGTFWGGDPREATYFHLYELTAHALKSVNSRLRVGGPATAQAAWVPAFIQYCMARHVPVDFVSTRVYGDDSAENVFGTHQKIPRRDMVIRAVRKVHRQVKASALPALPIIFSEFNATYTGTEVDVTDSPYIGPWLANTIRACDGLVDSLSYWTFSDVFEEGGVARSPFRGGFGLIATGDIPKASFNDFRLRGARPAAGVEDGARRFVPLQVAPDDSVVRSAGSWLLADRADGSDLHATHFGRRDLRGDLDGLVEVTRLDQIEACELLFRLGERAVGHGQASVAHAHRGCRGDRLQRLRGDALSARSQVGVARETPAVVHLAYLLLLAVHQT
jgi:hypothetical protein